MTCDVRFVAEDANVQFAFVRRGHAGPGLSRAPHHKRREIEKHGLGSCVAAS